MILWTPMPLELVLEGREAPAAPVMEIEQEGRRLLITPVSGAQARLERLISTDPADYLNPDYQPGRVITFQPRV